MKPPLRACLACLTPTAKPWHPLCRSCFAWHLAGQHLRRYANLTRLIQEARANVQ